MMNAKRTGPVFLRDVVNDSHLFKPLPRPMGVYPYRLDVRNVIGEVTWFLRERMSFHMVGDTGSARQSAFQHLVASALAQQAKEGVSASEKPAFLFHLGDIVYNHGEAHEYPKQFLGPYEDYPSPIFAIAGNHDGDINPSSELVYQSLDAFMDVFCDTYPRKILFGRGSGRPSMVQPHVYWTLITPLARFIGLYANVTKHGVIAADQREWFIEELRHADLHRPDQAIVVCVHHAPYSADTNHGSSLAMIAFLEDAFQAAEVKPDIVFSGHVHNYQRFSKHYDDGTVVPYVVAGAGGYADLHAVASPGDFRVEDTHPALQGVRLENYCDDHFGFLQIGVEKMETGLQLVGNYYTLQPDAARQGVADVALFEQFVIPIRHQTQLLC